MTDLMHDLGYPTTVESMRKRMDIIENIPLSFTFVATLEERMVGMMGIRQIYSYEEDGSTTQISLLVTKKEYQGQGIGKSLVGFAEGWALGRGSNILYLTSGIKPERIQAHDFYKSIGFDTTGYRFVKKLER
ncbi:MAG: GNAT family N-acetyltransferase [Bacillota bacterium]